MEFRLTSEFRPTGDQPEAIQQLVEAFRAGEQFQTLLGVTGSGKTFTVANMIQELGRPVLVLSHNKTLNSSSSFPKMQWNTLSATTTTISLRPTYR